MTQSATSATGSAGSASLRTSALAAFALAACAIQAWPFLAGVRLTADEVSWHAVAMRGFDGFEGLLKWLYEAARGQGRIGQAINHAANLIAVVVHESLAGRLVFVAGWFVTMYLFALYVSRLVGQVPPVALFLVATALVPLEFHHLPPSAYPLMLTPPMLGLLTIRLFVQARYMAAPGPVPLLPLVALTPLVWFLVVWQEYQIAFAASLAAFTYATLAAAQGGGLAGLRGVVVRHRRLIAFEALWLAVPLAAYVAFRLYSGEAYDGVTVGGTATGALETLAWHIADGTGLPLLMRLDMSALALSPLVGLIGAAACLAALTMAARRIEPGRPIVAAAFFSVGMAALVTLPIAATAKYQRWCLEGSSCLYVDSRLSFLWIVSAGFLLACAVVRALRPALRRPVSVMLCTAVAALYFATHAHNAVISSRMHDIAQAWPRARALACSQTGAWESLDDAALLEIVDPSSRVRMHAGFDRGAYWRLYMRHSIANGACAA